MRYAALSGGKRIRPVLVYGSAKALGMDIEALDKPACAVELIHSYSLVHDDLPAMDDDDLRRGRPTCHKAFDEATAILAGDALQTLAFQVLATEASLTPEARIRMLTELARASGNGAHTAIISLFHPSFWTFTPSVDTYRLWKALPELMAAQGQVPVTMDEILHFAEDREGATLAVDSSGDGGWTVTYEVSEEGTGQMLVVPELLGGRRLAMPDREVIVVGSLGGTRWLATPLSGSGTVEVVRGSSSP